jgi:hypothetical protein
VAACCQSTEQCCSRRHAMPGSPSAGTQDLLGMAWTSVSGAGGCCSASRRMTEVSLVGLTSEVCQPHVMIDKAWVRLSCDALKV